MQKPSCDTSHVLRFTFLLGSRWHVWIFGLLLDVKVHVVLLHVEVDGGGRVAVHRRLEAADRRPVAGAGGVWTHTNRDSQKDAKTGFIEESEVRYVLGMVSSFSSASCSVSLSSNLMSLNQDGSECPSRELTLSLSGDGVSENSVLYTGDEEA